MLKRIEGLSSQVVTIAGTDYPTVDAGESFSRSDNNSLRLSEDHDFLIRWDTDTALPSLKAKVVSDGRQLIISEIQDKRKFGGFIRLICSYPTR